MTLAIAAATEAEVPSISALRTAVAEELTRRHGRGHWSHRVTARGVTRDLQTSRVLVALDDGVLVGMVRLATRKPWAIDPAHFAAVPRPLYLMDVAVDPAAWGRGVATPLVYLERLLDPAAWAAPSGRSA
jgi:GNAT superfamily N-acetyltransferase